MLARDFAYWLQGYFELADIIQPQKPESEMTPLEKQIKCIRNHLNMVFKHEIDPSHGDAAHQAVLTQAHTGGGAPGQPPKSPLEALLGPGALLPGVDTMGVRLNC